jgi:hypothetical protein
LNYIVQVCAYFMQAVDDVCNLSDFDAAPVAYLRFSSIGW